MHRRNIIKLALTSGAALYIKPLSVHASGYDAEASFKLSSPVNRLILGSSANFSGDDPTRAHAILWNREEFLKKERLTGKKILRHVTPVVIIGGGIAGLTSAYLLRDLKPLVLEQAPRFGGNSKAEQWRGIDYSIGAAYICEPEDDSDIANLLSELKLLKEATVKAEEGPVLLDNNLVRDFWSGQHLSCSRSAKRQFQFLKEYFQKVALGEEIPYPDIPVSDPEGQAVIDALDTQSFYAHLVSVSGQALHPHIDTAIEHYCWSSLGASAREVSAAAGLNFYAAEFNNLLVYPGGNAAIAERLYAELHRKLGNQHLRTNALVLDVEPTISGVKTTFLNGEGSLEEVYSKVAVMACPKFLAAKVVRGLAQKRSADLQKLGYRAYLVANTLLSKQATERFYDLFLLGQGLGKFDNISEAATKRGATDVVSGTFASTNSSDGVLTLYRALPYDGGRQELYAEGAFERYNSEFRRQLSSEILPALGLQNDALLDLRITRWGHPLPVARTGLYANRVVDRLREPFEKRIFFINQDNFALPAFETAIAEAFSWADPVRRMAT